MAKLLLAVLCALPVTAIALPASALPESNHSRIEEVQVFADSFSILDIPRNISVISAEDIERSAYRSLPDLLSREANITLTSFSGNEKFSRIDLRGSGDTGASNILTLIDGVKINTPDLAGADFSTVSLQQIEQIEIVRGANTVRFGGGASHGVINIITKRPENTSIFLKRETGSYNNDAEQLSVTGAADNYSISANLVNRHSDGYRDHNALETSDFLLQLRKQFGSHSHLVFKHQRHRDDYELPGPLSRSELENGTIDRRSASAASGIEGRTEDDSQFVQWLFEPVDQLSLKINSQYRERKNLFIEGQSIALSKSADLDIIDLQTSISELLIKWKTDVIGVPSTLTIGYDYQEASYLRTNGGQGGDARIAHRGDTLTRASFIHTQFEFNKYLKLNLGYRKDSTENRYQRKQRGQDTSSPFCDSLMHNGFLIITNCPVTDFLIRTQFDRWNLEAYESNLLFAPLPDLRLYASAAQTFRVPNTDELALPSKDDLLRPQTAERYELGSKYENDYFGLNLGFFRFYTRDEIIFRDNLLVNGNHNAKTPIRRTGVEVELLGNISPSLKLGLNIGYTEAETASKTRLPHTARTNSSAILNWEVTDYINFNYSYRYVGDRLDGNDENATELFPRIPSYQVSDASVRLRFPAIDLTLYFNVNNLFNENYITASYSNSGYPAPERNFSGGIDFAF